MAVFFHVSQAQITVGITMAALGLYLCVDPRHVELRNYVRLLLNVELRNYVISRQIVIERRVT